MSDDKLRWKTPVTYKKLEDGSELIHDADGHIVYCMPAFHRIDMRMLCIVGTNTLSSIVQRININDQLRADLAASQERVTELDVEWRRKHDDWVAERNELMKEKEAHLATFRENEERRERITALEDDLAINKNAYAVWLKRCREVEAALRPFAEAWDSTMETYNGDIRKMSAYDSIYVDEDYFKNAAAAIAKEDNDDKS